jgi:hypothetical protein
MYGQGVSVSSVKLLSVESVAQTTDVFDSVKRKGRVVYARPPEIDVCTTYYCAWQHEARHVQLSLSGAFSAPPWLIPSDPCPRRSVIRKSPRAPGALPGYAPDCGHGSLASRWPARLYH